MLHIKLHDRRAIGPEDPMGRDWVGYDPLLPNTKLFEQNRGRWVLGKRAERERYVLFSYTGDHTIKFVAEIHGYEPVGQKRAIVGQVLEPEHPVAKRWLGAPAPDNWRNPVTYGEEPEGGAPTCACGCGEFVPLNREWVPGHDKKAVNERIMKKWGGAVGFVTWFDKTFPSPKEP